MPGQAIDQHDINFGPLMSYILTLPTLGLQLLVVTNLVIFLLFIGLVGTNFSEKFCTKFNFYGIIIMQFIKMLTIVQCP